VTPVEGPAVENLDEGGKEGIKVAADTGWMEGGRGTG